MLRSRCSHVTVLVDGKEPLKQNPEEAAIMETPDWLRQMESILETLNEGVVIVDNQLRVIFANDAVIRLGGYERGELQGRTPDTIFPPEDLPYIMRQHEAGQRYGRHRHEFYLPRKDGEKIPAIAGVPFMDPTNRITRCLS